MPEQEIKKDDIKEDVKKEVVEVVEKNEHIYKIDNFDKLIDSVEELKNKINNKDKKQPVVIEENNEMHLGGENKNCIVDHRNKKLNNYEIFKKTLNIIDKNENKKILPFSPKFVNYMREYTKAVENKKDEKQFMAENIFEEVKIEALNIE